MSDSQPPPSMQIPVRSAGNFPYIVGSVVLCALIAALLAWKLKSPAASRPSLPASAPIAGAEPLAPAPMHAPPPPPALEEDAPDAGADAGMGAGLAPRLGAPSALAAPTPCGNCGEGESSPGLAAALSGTAQSARGCYNRALQHSEVSGSMAVVVQVASNGAICSASITNDSVRSSEIGSCVLGKFRGKMFPPPQSGCVVVTIPITFTIKQ